VKVHGGTMYSSWANAAMALHHLEGLEDRLKSSKEKATALFNELKNDVTILPIKDGSNIFSLQLPAVVNADKFRKYLFETYSVLLPRANNGIINIMVNETLLRQDNNNLALAFRDAIKNAK
ncbi:MAG TPA: hypothetical protein VK498_01205, partial [Ferruginibacter sp.]|nr:hypothetical protein [Ferruginibacter sp.]